MRLKRIIQFTSGISSTSIAFVMVCQKYLAGMAGIPKKQMLVLCSALISSALGVTFVFPFIPFQVASFGVEPANLGYYSGLIGSCYMFGRALSSVPWGLIADRYGRKRVIFVSQYAMAVSIMLFGFSNSFFLAISLRAFSGFCNGILGPGKSLASEVCAKDEQTQATAMTLVMSSASVGLIIGPTIGGWLSEPVEKYPEMFSPSGLFGRFPFLLPCGVCSLLILVSGMLVHFCLNEPKVAGADGAKHADGAKQRRCKLNEKGSMGNKKHGKYVSLTEENESSADRKSVV